MLAFKGFQLARILFLEPRLTLDASLEIFKRLRREQPSHVLPNLTLVAGDYNRREGGGLRIHRGSWETTPVQFMCRIESNREESCRKHEYYDYYNDLGNDDYDVDE